MAITRRALLGELLGTGAAAALLTKPGVAEALGAAMAQAGVDSPGNAAAFWGSFTEPQVHARGLFHKPSPGTDTDRQVNFLHYSDDGLRYTEQIAKDELPDYPGDVTANVNVGGVRLSTEDRAKFEELKSAQLRIDLLQGQKMYNMIDPLAWMALASIFPTKGGSLPPLQNLSFDPATTAQGMSNIVLPGGIAHLAVNVSMLHKENPFLKVLEMLVTDATSLAPVLGLPAISVTALTGFSKLYGVLENRTTFLFQARPTLAYATQQARTAQNSTIGMNLPEGDYVLVPQAHTDDLKPYMDKLKLVNGYLVSKDAPSSSSVYEQAQSTKPDISYLTMHVGVSPLMQIGPPQPSSSAAKASSSSSSKSGSSSKKTK